MNRRSPLLLLFFAAAVAVGCSGAPSPSGSPSQGGPSAPATAVLTAAAATATPSAPSSVGAPFDILHADPLAGFVPPITCSGVIGAADPVAIVRLAPTGESEGEIVIRDYVDPGEDQTVCTFEPFSNASPYTAKFIDARHLVMDVGSDERPGLYAIVDLPEVRLRWFQLPVTVGWGSVLISVAPGLDRIAWKSVNPEGTGTDEIHVTTAAGDKVLARLPDQNQGRCGSREDSNDGGYTASGSHLFVLNQPDARSNSLLVFEAEETKLSIVPPETGWPDRAWPAMAVWSPTTVTLYFSQMDDVWSWTPDAGKRLFLPRVRWFRPTISADGSLLAYEADRAEGGTDVFLIRVGSDGGPDRVGSGGSNPVFVDATRLWYQRDRGAGGCEGSSEPTDVIRDIATGSEVATDVDAVLAIWPSTGSNH